MAATGLGLLPGHRISSRATSRWTAESRAPSFTSPRHLTSACSRRARRVPGAPPGRSLKVDPQTLGSRTLTVGMEDMPPGDSIGVHKHLEEDEVVFVHRGEVEVTLGDFTVWAAAGGTVFIPRGTWIGFRVKGSDTATIVFAFNVPGFEKCLRFLSAPVGMTFHAPTASAVAAARRECHQVRRVDETQ
jgi:quercetin dioxygenase-like cupin family protein